MTDMAEENYQARQRGDALREAAYHGDLVKLSSLLAVDFALVNSQHSLNHWTPLHWAAKANSLSCVRLLLNHGADPTITNDKGLLASDLASDPQCKELLSSASPIAVAIAPIASPASAQKASEKAPRDNSLSKDTTIPKSVNLPKDNTPQSNPSTVITSENTVKDNSSTNADTQKDVLVDCILAELPLSSLSFIASKMGWTGSMADKNSSSSSQRDHWETLVKNILLPASSLGSEDDQTGARF